MTSARTSPPAASTSSALPTGTLLHLGADAVVRVEGLRNPCVQIEAYDEGLLRHVAGRAPDGSVVRRAGVMGVVVSRSVRERPVAAR